MASDFEAANVRAQRTAFLLYFLKNSIAATVAVFVFPTPAPPDNINNVFYPINLIAYFCLMLVL